MFDMMTIMNKVKEAQAKIKETQAGLVHLTAEGESGAGMVKVNLYYCDSSNKVTICKL